VVDRRQLLGRSGEWIALLLLLLKGYRLRHRRWQTGTGEIDLVMQRSGTTIFVEVKTRSSDLFGGAAAAVSRAKQQRVVRAAGSYLTRFGLWDRPCRFDVVTIEKGKRFLGWRLRHYVDAFHPELGRQL
jgi:putative endonuclease